jgi:hypothetical protein
VSMTDDGTTANTVALTTTANQAPVTAKTGTTLSIEVGKTTIAAGRRTSSRGRWPQAALRTAGGSSSSTATTAKPANGSRCA